jgi:hypothetical protein
LTVTSREHVKSGIRWLLAALGLAALDGILFFGFHFSIAYMVIFSALPLVAALSCAFVSFRRAFRSKE